MEKFTLEYSESILKSIARIESLPVEQRRHIVEKYMMQEVDIVIFFLIGVVMAWFVLMVISILRINAPRTEQEKKQAVDLDCKEFYAYMAGKAQKKCEP